MSQRHGRGRPARGYTAAYSGDLNPDLPTSKRYRLPVDPESTPQWDVDEQDSHESGILARIRATLRRS